jgi:hypothetical protein
MVTSEIGGEVLISFVSALEKIESVDTSNNNSDATLVNI